VKCPPGQQVSQILKGTKRKKIKEHDSRKEREKRNNRNKNKKAHALQQTLTHNGKKSSKKLKS